MEKRPGNSMKRGLIIAIVAVVVVAALLVLLLLLPEKDVDSDPSASPTESFAPVETHYLINEQFTALKTIEVYTDSGELQNKIIATHVGDNSFDVEYSVEPAREGWEYNQDELRASVVNVASLSSLSLVDEAPTDLVQYGLDKPAFTVKASFEGGTSYTLKVGGLTALANSYYCLAGDGKVYAVGAVTLSKITRTEMEYRTYEFFPDYYDKSTLEVETNGEITYIRLYDPSNDYELLVRKIEEGEFENAPSQMLIERPVEVFASEEQAEQRLINLVVLITVNGLYVDDPTEEQLAECGLDNPKEVWIKNDSGREVHYLIGKSVGANAYIMVEGVNTILTATQVYPTIFETNYADIMYKLLLGDNIRDVEKVDFVVNGKTRTLKIDYTEPTEENVAGIVSGSLDGQPISSTNASRMYGAALNLSVYEAYSEGDVTLSGTPAIKVTVTRKDGGKHTLELYSINDRRYAVKLDGVEKYFYVHRDTVKVLTDAFGYIDRGETIPRI